MNLIEREINYLINDMLNRIIMLHWMCLHTYFSRLEEDVELLPTETDCMLLEDMMERRRRSQWRCMIPMRTDGGWWLTCQPPERISHTPVQYSMIILSLLGAWGRQIKVCIIFQISLNWLFDWLFHWLFSYYQVVWFIMVTVITGLCLEVLLMDSWLTTDWLLIVPFCVNDSFSYWI